MYAKIIRAVDDGHFVSSAVSGRNRGIFYSLHSNFTHPL